MPEAIDELHTDSKEPIEERIPIFISFRYSDGLQLATRMDNMLRNRLVRLARGTVRLDPYFSDKAPAASDFLLILRPRLQTARALLLICTEDATRFRDGTDHLRYELEWWSRHRRAAPIVIQSRVFSNEELPPLIRERWPRSARITVEIDGEGQLTPHESEVIERITSGFQIAEEGYREQELTRLRRLSVGLLIALLLAVGAGALAINRAVIASRQRAQTQRALDQARDRLADAVGLQTNRLISDGRLLAAGALAGDWTRYPPSFDLTAGLLALRPSIVSLERELSFGLVGSGLDWIRCNDSADVIVAHDSSRRVHIIRAYDGAKYSLASQSIRTDHVAAFTRDDGTLWIADGERGLFRWTRADPVPQATPFKSSVSHVLSLPSQDRLVLAAEGSGISFTSTADWTTRFEKLPFNEFSLDASSSVLAVSDYTMKVRLYRLNREMRPEVIDLQKDVDQIHLSHAYVQLNASGDRLAALLDAAGGAVLLLYDTRSGELIRRNDFAASDVFSGSNLQFNARGDRLMVVYRGGVSMIDAATGAIAWGVAAPRALQGAAFDPLGRYIALVQDRGRFAILKAENGSQLEIVDAMADEIGGLTFTSDGSRVLSATVGGNLRVWSVRNPEQLERPLAGSPLIQVATLDADRGRIAAAFPQVVENNLIWLPYVYDSQKLGPSPIILPSIVRITSLGFDPSGRRLCVGNTRGEIACWDLLNSRESFLWNRIHENEIDQIGFTDGGDTVISKSAHRIAYIDSGKGTVLWKSDFPDGPAACTALSEDGKIAVGLRDKTVSVYERGRLRWKVSLTEKPRYLAFDELGHLYVVGSTSIVCLDADGALSATITPAAPIPDGIPIVLSKRRALALIVEFPDRSQHLQLISLLTGRQLSILNPWAEELLSIPNSILLFLAAKRDNSTVLALSRTGELVRWGIDLPANSEERHAHTGLSVNGSTVFPSTQEKKGIAEGNAIESALEK